TGLGLSICQRLVALFDGEIGVESEVGKGSDFWFTMLLEVSTKEKVESSEKSNVDKKVIKNTVKNARVLMAEDNRINAEFAKEMLEKLNCEVVVVNNGKEAVDILQKDRNFAMIFMDCLMPIMDGFAATQALLDEEKKKKLKHIPIIALTANAMKEDRENCLKAGMDDYLPKPVKQKDFAEMISKWGKKEGEKK
ncbi:MAG: response regulator, partial [Rickettsiaceae bacterium]|nr:response regulator [Rickettsiaceae bacterium]